MNHDLEIIKECKLANSCTAQELRLQHDDSVLQTLKIMNFLFKQKNYYDELIGGMMKVSCVANRNGS